MSRAILMQTTVTLIAIVVSCFIGCTERVPKMYVVPEGVDSRWPPATEQEVQALEKKLGAPLPEDYREFLLTVNGVAPGLYTGTGMGFKITGDDDEYWVPNLFTISLNEEAKWNELLSFQHAYHFDWRVPKRFVAIGRTLGIDMVCISLSGHDKGAVYYWAPDGFGDSYDKDTEKYLTLLAPSFREFWSKLEVDNGEY